MKLNRRQTNAYDAALAALRELGKQWNLNEAELLAVYSALADNLIEQGEAYAANLIQQQAGDPNA